MNTSEWARVTRQRLCKVCGKPDWCGLSSDGSVACCMRVESQKRLANGGYLHRLTARPDQTSYSWRSHQIIRLSLAAQPGLGKLACQYEKAASEGMVKALGAQLGVSAESFRRLRIGWDRQAWTFPMFDAAGKVVGIRRRFPNGEKLSVKGGHDGLFVPLNLKTDGLLLIAEGATDAAALLTLLFEVVGRPNCSGGTWLCIGIARGRDVVVVADGDWPGRNGAHRLAIVLRRYCPSVRVIQPPDGIKDARAWLQSGATRHDIQQVIEAAKPLELTIKSNGGSAKPAAKGNLACQTKSYSTMSAKATTAR